MKYNFSITVCLYVSRKYFILSQTCGVYCPCDKPLFYQRVMLYLILPVQTIFDKALIVNVVDLVFEDVPVYST